PAGHLGRLPAAAPAASAWACTSLEKPDATSVQAVEKLLHGKEAFLLGEGKSGGKDGRHGLWEGLAHAVHDFGEAVGVRLGSGLVVVFGAALGHPARNAGGRQHQGELAARFGEVAEMQA
nr:hypothetical protein [Tanacetum cinerariifolium]